MKFWISKMWESRLLSAALIAMGLATQPLAAQTFSDELWEANRDVYDAILEHPFLREMQDGSLSPDTFAFYTVQDARYLRAFANALSVAAGKAPDPRWTRQLEADAQGSLAAERRLHEEVFATHGLSSADIAQIESTPDGFAYINFLIATAHDRPFEEALAALLPCYLIYWEVGKALQAQGSPNATYQAWIDDYISPRYAKTVTAFLEVIDSVAASADTATRERMHEQYRRGSQYEWLFWDAAYRHQTWLPK
ncbi:uncharacterized protein METZ01_LOCUS31259 [marine metagenome]|uniref:Thiaminase-2/PQQC domain-containing protein n=1 Tax=marine metagenome TaxID=408172 RepID=A0A381QGF6_9ZZZZ|tara:strand:- start:3827 stop:4582 length:756 start_codon:yes stop_codon:yes gene_type:complete